MKKTYNETDEDKIRELLLGHKVVSVIHDDEDSGILVLDNGTVINVNPNSGGCSCGAGDYYLKVLERVDNIITRVDFEVGSTCNPDEYGYADTAYRIFVLAGDERINLLSVEGDDGSGYYGTGYELVVRIPET